MASLMLTAPVFAQTATTASSEAKPAVRQVNVLPLSFEEQRQDPNSAPTFVSRSPGHALTVSADQAALTVRGTGASESTLRMTLSGARTGVQMTALDALPGKVYHATSDSRGLQSGNTTYRRVKGSGIYPGIDLIYYGSDRQLEFDFVVAPRADARQIRLAFSGADSMTLEPGGELAFRLGGEVVRLKKPRLYQERGDARDEVAGGYRVVDAKTLEVAFQVDDYDQSRPLIIDPTIVFATYRGGSGIESPNQIRANTLGEVYLFADTRDPSTIPPGNAYQSIPLAPPQPGFNQCFLTKISSDGSTAIYTMIFEGAQCQAMDLSPQGGSGDTRIHLQVGTSFHYQRTITESLSGSLSLDLLQGAYDACQVGSCGPVNAMRTDANGDVYFVMFNTNYELRKVDTHGNLVGSITLIQPPLYPIGGQNYLVDQILGLDVDNSGRAYVIGYGSTPGIITPTADAFQRLKPSGNVCNDVLSGTCNDAFLLAIDTNAFQIEYASYFGGGGDDRAFAVAWDPVSDSVYLTGTASSSNFPITPGSFLGVGPNQQFIGSSFLAKLNLSMLPAQQLTFSTLLSQAGGAPTAITVLRGGLAAIVGQVTDCFGCFPAINSLYLAHSQNRSRPFLSVISADGASMPFSTFLDNTPGADSFATAVASNGSSVIWVATSTNDPTLATPGSLQPTINGDWDALVQAIDVTGVVPFNDPPEISFSPSTIDVSLTTPATGAIFPLICGRLFTCSLDEPDGELITNLVWFGENGLRISNPGTLPAPAGPGIIPGAFVSAGIGTHTYTLVARDENGGIGTGTLTVNVHGENTFPGSAQHLILTDARFVDDSYRPLGSEHPIELTFSTVTSPGLTWLESRSDLVPPPPAGLQAGSPPYYYDVHSNATFVDVVNVCVNTRGMSFARPKSDVLIYTLAGGVWTPLGNQYSPNADHVCGDVSSLGTFALFYPQVPETAISTMAGTGFAENAIDGLGGDPRDDFNDFVPAVQSTLTRPGSIAVATAATPPQLFVADNGSTFGSRIRRLDLGTGQISTVIYQGGCYGFAPLAVDPAGQFLYCAQVNPATGLDIVRYDLSDSTQIVLSSAPEVLAMALDSSGNLFYSDGNIHRVPAGGGSAQLIFAFNNGPAALRLLYFDRAWTLAFDAEGALLAGGSTLIRILPGADGAIDGSPDETVAQIGGIPGANLIGYSEPFSGDGLPVSQAMLNSGYQMVVASDGAVVYADGISHRIRRIDPGADGVVNGGPDEIVQTIAGYFSSTPPNPSNFATSEYGDYRGLVEDPLSPGRFILASQSANKLQRFGIPGAAANRPPTVTIPFAASVQYADSPAGGTINLFAIGSDPDGDFLTYSWSGPFTNNPVTTNSFLTAHLAVGSQQTITVTVDDGHGGTASASIKLDMVGVPFIAGTATPVDSALGSGFIFTYTPVTVTPAVVPAGPAQVFLRTHVDQIPPIPANLQAGSPPIYFDVSTTAAPLAAPINICIDTRGMSFPVPSSIRMYQYTSTAPLPGWTDITQSVNAAANQICGSAGALGTFAIFYQPVPATAIRTIAGNGAFTLNAGDFVPGPATSTPLSYLYSGAYDRARNFLYVSEGTGYILRVDLNTSTIARVAGNGIFFPGSLSDPLDLRDDVIDGGDPFNTFVGGPFEMTVNAAGDLVFFDRQTCRIRRLDFVQNKLFNLAGNGTCGYSGDGFAASNAALGFGPLAFDAAGNLFLGDSNHARVRRIDGVTSIISTVAGDGTFGSPVSGAPALTTIGLVQGMAVDAQGYLVLAAADDLLRISPGADGLIRGDADETISVIAGCHTNCVQPFGGDGLPISHPQVFFGSVGYLTVAPDGAVIVSDRYRIRRIAPGADGVVTGAADEIIQTIGGYNDPAPNVISNFNGDTFATQSLLAPSDFVVQDNTGQIIVVDTNNYRVRRFGFLSGATSGTDADLAVTATASLSTAGVGQQVRYTVTVTNNGPASASGVTLTLPLPAGARLDDVQPLAPCVLPLPGSGPVSCDGGTLAAGQHLVFSFLVTPLSEGTLSATFAVTGQGTDPQPANNAVTVDVDVEPSADLAVSIVAPAAGATVGVGSPLTFDVVMSNLGPSSAFVARLRWALPAGLAFVSAAIPGGTCDSTGGIITCDVEPLAAGASVHASIGVRPTATGPITAVFDVSSPLYDGNQNNNSAARSITAAFLPAVITIQESIFVNDAAVPQPSRIIGVVENIVVTDSGAGNAPIVQPSTLIGVLENIVVTDSGVGSAPIVLPSVLLGVTEQIVVADDVRPEPPATLVLTPATATSPLGSPHTVTATIADSSDENARVVLTLHSATATRVRFNDPGAANSPLSISTSSTGPAAFDIVVNLATSSTGALSSTAAQVVAAINADPAASSLVVAQTWPGNTGTGITRPRPLAALTPVVFSVTGATTRSASCAATVPGVCSITYAGGSVGTDVISAYLDLNGNSVADSGEPSATAGKIWTRDAVPPVLALPVNVSTQATGPAGATVFFVATAIDNVDGAVGVTCVPASGSTFQLGTRPVNCSATDAAGNTATGQFNVTVFDFTPPVLSLPANIITAPLSAAGTAVTYTATANDAVYGAVPAICSPASASTFPVGTTTVSCSATDSAGNTSVGTFTVTVTAFTVPGTVQLIASATFTKNAAGQYVATITIRNTGTGTANVVQVSSGVLNSTAGAPFPLVFGTVAPGASVVQQMTFPPGAGTAGSGNVLRLSVVWTGGAASFSQRAVLP